MKVYPNIFSAISVFKVASTSRRLLVAGLLLVSANAHAQIISGTIQFSGGAQLDNANLGLATRFVSIFGPTGPGSNPGVIAATETGSYVGIANGTPATFTPFTFNPAVGSVLPLWTLTVGTITYSFDATSVQVAYQDSFFLDIAGQGIAHITGMSDTYGTWSITDTGGDGALPVFTFGAATQVGGAIVPEPSTWAMLIVLAVPFMWSLRMRRDSKPQAGQKLS
jgi:hypothetical protein